MTTEARTGGQLVIDCLAAQGVDRVFCVPGESYLPVLDALHQQPIQTVVARQEGGAAMMAEADGKLTGRPGVCLVTRGPGATNGASGIHVAKQDSTPMVMFVGQIERGMTGRDAFQEVDFRQMFRDLAKWVEQIDDVDRIPEIIGHAWHVAMSGRPGPVVLALPEDMLREMSTVAPGPPVVPAEPAPGIEQMQSLLALLEEAERPMMILGGSRWRGPDVATLQRLAERWDIPVAASFRRQQLFDHEHGHYAGDLGIGANPALLARIADSDLLIALGARLSENPSQSYTLLDIPRPRQRLVHVLSGAEELGRVYHAHLSINATPRMFLEAWDALETTAPRGGEGRGLAAHDAYLRWSEGVPAGPGGVQMGEIMAHLREVLPADAVLTNGAGNYSGWLHRFYRFRGFGTQVAPTSGSMGYGLPAAIAAKLRHPEREVVCFAGDGCFQMTGLELGTALQNGAHVIVLVIDNGSYGTIRMHQERDYPRRVVATDLRNPDFAALARAYGAHAETVETTDQFADAFARARSCGTAALIHIRTDVEAITPATTLTALRGDR